MDKEKIYDEQINPLMAQIIEICQKNEIPFACQFALNNNDMVCTSCMSFDNEQIKRVYKTMTSDNSSLMAVTVTTQ